MNSEQNLNAATDAWDDGFAIDICRFLDGKLSSVEIVEFQERLRGDEPAREQLATIAYQQNAIREGNSQTSIPGTNVQILALAKSLGISSDASSKQAAPPFITNAQFGVLPAVMITFLTVVLFLGGWAWLANSEPAVPDDTAIARISAIAGSDVYQQLEKRPDSTLLAGDMVCFGSGVVEVDFPGRATLVLTGPAKLRIDSAKRATLLFGRLSATVSELGKGFIVETPDAEVTDLGTEFSIAISEKEGTSVKVTSGLVDVAPLKRTTEKTRITTGQSRCVNATGAVTATEESHRIFSGIVESLDRPDLKVVTNKDSFVMGGPWANQSMQKQATLQNLQRVTNQSDLLVKYDIIHTNFNRIAVIGFDLSKVPRERLLGARLRLSVAVNDMSAGHADGFHTYEPNREWQFIVEGAWDQGEQEWTEESLTWNNAPGVDAKSKSGELQGAGAPMKVAEFSIVGKGHEGEQVVIASKQLVDFLKLDNDGKVTILIRRKTGTIQAGTRDITLHGFAGRENEKLAPPTLELWLPE